MCWRISGVWQKSRTFEKFSTVDLAGGYLDSDNVALDIACQHLSSTTALLDAAHTVASLSSLIGIPMVEVMVKMPRRARFSYLEGLVLIKGNKTSFKRLKIKVGRE